MPLLFWAVGLCAAILIGRALLSQVRRMTRELHRTGVGSREGVEASTMQKLERDPVSGVYRPKPSRRSG
jgi:hypothetical protein